MDAREVRWFEFCVGVCTYGLPLAWPADVPVLLRGLEVVVVPSEAVPLLKHLCLTEWCELQVLEH